MLRIKFVKRTKICQKRECALSRIKSDDRHCLHAPRSRHGSHPHKQRLGELALKLTTARVIPFPRQWVSCVSSCRAHSSRCWQSTSSSASFTSSLASASKESDISPSDGSSGSRGPNAAPSKSGKLVCDHNDRPSLVGRGWESSFPMQPSQYGLARPRIGGQTKKMYNRTRRGGMM